MIEDSFAQAVVADAGPDQTVASGATVTLDSSGSTPPTSTLLQLWEQTAGPTVSLSREDIINPTFIAPTGPTTLTFEIALKSTSDLFGAGTRDAVTITVTAPPNQPPTANAGRDRTFPPGATVTLSGTGTDPDGNDNNLTYTWEQNPTDTVELTDENSARTTFTAPSDPTELVFTLTVSDGTSSTTDDITITIKERVQTRNIKEMSETLVSAKITGPNQITMTYNEELSTFINSYLNFIITGESMPRSIIGINGSPSIEEMANIDGVNTTVFITTLTFDGEPVPSGSTGSMYIQHADHYLAFIQVSDGQN